MKGKGKAIPVVKDCQGLVFPDLTPVEHAKQCPRYTAVLSRDADEGISMEELDILQTEMETLLAAAGKRLKLLEGEITILNNWQDKKDIVKTKGSSKQPESPVAVKRGKPASEEKPSKKFKDSSGKAAQPLTPIPSRGKNKHIQGKGIQPTPADAAVTELPKIIPKNENVTRLWQSVEPYCAELTGEDVKFLEELLKSQEDDVEYCKIPALGKHYTERWAQEDLIEEQRQGSKISDKRKSLNNNGTGLSMELLRNLESNHSNCDDSPFGPLTQRLVSALIEENIMTAIDDSMADVNPETVEETSSMSPRALAKELKILNPSQLEKRIKRELEDLGVLESEEETDDNPDDEILTELRSKQQELHAVISYNQTITKKLIRAAQDEMSNQELKKKLTAVEAEMMEAYRKIQNARLKKKPATKKEKDNVWKLLRERERIMKTLES